MKRYYAEYPRGFANEYTIYVVAEPADSKVLGLSDDERISRAKAIYLGIQRPRGATREGEQWYGGLCGGSRCEEIIINGRRIDRAPTYTEMLNECAGYTHAAADEARVTIADDARWRHQDAKLHAEEGRCYQAHLANGGSPVGYNPNRYGDPRCVCDLCKPA